MNVKICGIRRYEDARAALDAGAWAVGFVFHRPSRRFITPGDAAAIVRRLPPGTLTVGVFVDEPIDRLNDTISAAGLKGAQLHGDEDALYAGSVRADFVIKAFHVDPDFDPAEIASFPSRHVLLDTFLPSAPGGTGVAFDWSIARRAGERRPVIIAGGITPENVEQCLADARPAGIDVSSGVESSPGEKDPARLVRLFEAVERFESRGAGKP